MSIVQPRGLGALLERVPALARRWGAWRRF